MSSTAVRQIGNGHHLHRERPQWKRFALALALLSVSTYWAANLIANKLIADGRAPSDETIRAAGAAIRKASQDGAKDLAQTIDAHLRNSELLIRRVDFGTAKNPMKTSPSTIVVPPEVVTALRQPDDIPLVRIVVSPTAGHVVKGKVLDDLTQWWAARVIQLPAFLVVEFTSEEDFGTFETYSSERFVLCAMHLGSDNLIFAVQPQDPRLFRVLSSNRVIWSMLGRPDAFDDWPISAMVH